MKKSKNKSIFYTGLISLLPLVLTFTIFSWLFKFGLRIVRETFITKIIRKILYILYGNNVDDLYFRFLTYLITIMIIVIFIWLVGLTAKVVVVDKLLLWIKKLLVKIPIVKHIYNTINQIVEIINQDSEAIYKRVVTVEYPKEGIYSLGFMTSEENHFIEKATGIEQMCNIFIPTSPNPTSGMIVCVPLKYVKFLDIPVEEAFKFIVSGGFISSETDIENIKEKNETVNE